MARSNEFKRIIIVFIGILLVALVPLLSVNSTNIVSADEEITDLTGTTWLIKKPSEWGYSGIGTLTGWREASDDDEWTSVYNVEYTMSYNEYVTAQQIKFELCIVRAHESGSYLAAMVGPAWDGGVYPAIQILDGYSYLVEAVYGTSDEDLVELGDVEITLNIIGGDDTNNSVLISWLNENATLVSGDNPTPSPSTGVVDSALTVTIFAVAVGFALAFVGLSRKRNVA